MNLRAETMEHIDATIPRYPHKRSAVMPLLHAVQRDQGYISNEAIAWVAGKLGLEPVNVYEVVTFYPFFRQAPIGRRHIRLCRTLSCALCGGFGIAEVLEEAFECRMGETAPDGSATLEWAECLASCDKGPVLMLDDDLHENLTEEGVRELARTIRAENAEGSDSSMTGNNS